MVTVVPDLEVSAMKLPIPPQLFLAAASALVVLSGCAGMGPGLHSRGAGGSSGMGSPMEPMDMQSMCERHKKMMAGRSPQEQQAMMQEQMKSMSPERRQRMEAMMQQCR